MNNYYSNKDVILFKKIPHVIISYNTILIIILVLLLIVCNLKYKKFINYYAYYNEDYLTFETNFIEFNDLYINNKKYNYSVVSIDNSDKNNYLVKIKSKIKDKWVKNNSYIKIRFLQNKTSILNEVVKIIWKG